MEVEFEVRRLLQRQGEIQRAMRRPGGIRITVERELYQIRERLRNIPAGLQSLPPAPSARPSDSQPIGGRS